MKNEGKLDSSDQELTTSKRVPAVAVKSVTVEKRPDFLEEQPLQ
jgi:hypothetical protein